MFSVAYWYGPPAFRIPVGGTRAIPGPPRLQANNYPSTYSDQNSNTQANCKPFYQIIDDLTDYQYQARSYTTIFLERIASMKAREYPVKQVNPGNPVNNAGNTLALKATLWGEYLRPFGYGEAKLPILDSVARTNRHGFSSFLKFDNSPYLELNGMYEPDSVVDEVGVSDFTCDGVIPYPFIQPELAAAGNGNVNVTVTWDAASYEDGQNKNHLFNIFPEEELYQCRHSIDNLPIGWDALAPAVRNAFYEHFEFLLTSDADVVWSIDVPNETAPNLFRYPQANPANPWDTATQNTALGGSTEYHEFVFSRLYRTLAQFKKDPSNILDVGIKAADQAEFQEFQRNRVGAPAVSIQYINGATRMQTFPFRILCHEHAATTANESQFMQYKSNIPTLLDSASDMQQTLTDTSGVGVQPYDWEIESILSVGRKLRGTQVANVGAYPFTQTAHPKYAEFLHNAIGNLFEIRDFANTAANLILRDIYWEKSEFEHTVEIAGLSVQVPNIMLCFNNYGATYDIPGDGPRAYHLYTHDGVIAEYDRVQAGNGPTANNQQLGAQHGPTGAGTGLNRMHMSIPFANFRRFNDNNQLEGLSNVDFIQFTTVDSPPGLPKLAIFIPGQSHSQRFHQKNYKLNRDASKLRGKVFRSDVKISQHLCSPVLNPDMRLNCIAPLNHASRHLPPEMRDFQLLVRDVDFSFLQATSPPVLGDLVLSEFNGGIQQVAAQESLLYLPNFIEFKATVQSDMSFSVDCMTGKGVPGYLCVFCRDSDNVLEQPIIKRLSLQNLTTMKKSNSIVDTDVHELYHMTQRNVHPRSEYDSKAFNRRQTLLLAIEDIGIMGMEAKHYQRQKRVQIRVSGICTNEGTVTVIFIYNNRGLYVKGRQQSVVHM